MNNLYSFSSVGYFGACTEKQSNDGDCTGDALHLNPLDILDDDTQLEASDITSLFPISTHHNNSNVVVITVILTIIVIVTITVIDIITCSHRPDENSSIFFMRVANV